MTRTRRLAAIAFAGVFSLTFVGLVSAAPGPPANDDFADAFSISAIPATVVENSTHATVEGTEPTNTCNSVGETVWFSIAPGANMQLTASTLGSKASGGDYDTVLAVFTYSGSFTQVDCNDDSNVDPNHHHLSRVAFDATSGTTYYFQVGSFGGFQYKHSRLRFNLSFGPALDATVGSESGSNACFVHVTGSGLYPATNVYYDYSGSPDNVLGTVAGDGTFDNTSAFVEQAYTFHSLDFNGDPISTGSVNVSCVHT